MTPRTTGVTMIGMPSSGKSTYLAALYQALIDPTPGQLASLTRQPTTRAYLEELRQAWLRGEQLGHTGRDSGELVELDVTFPGAGQATLTVPDIAGEMYEEIFARRQVDALVAEHVGGAQGILLFTHPDHLRPRVPIAALREMQGLVGDADDVPVESGDRPFDARLLPGEVQLVDLLQWAMRERELEWGATSHRVAFLVSAWDRVDGRRTPADWLAVKMPMLKSFSETHQGRLEMRTYGVCAQGGDYSRDPVVDVRPRERAYVVLPDGSRQHDLTAPLLWATLP